MIINFDSITIDRAIPGLNWTPSRCSTLADLLAALVAQSSAQDVHAVSGRYDPAIEAIIITLSNNSTFSIPASLLLPVVADGITITGNGTTANKLTGYKVEYDAATGMLTITPPGGAPVTLSAQTALTEPATDTEGLLGAAGATVTTQQLLDALAHRANTPPTTNAAAKAALMNGVLNIPNPLPVANFVRTSKIGLKASYSATASSGTQDGNVLAYEWTAAARSGTMGTATLATPAAVTTAITFSAPGQYDITLTVTDANGNSASRSETINVARVIEVNNPNSETNDYFNRLSDAFSWILANGAPSATARWLVRIYGQFTETSTINALSYVDVYFMNGAGWTTAANPALQINVAETSWSAENNGHVHVRSTAVNGNGLLMLGAINYSTVHVRHLRVSALLNSAALNGVAGASGTMVIEDCVFGEVNSSNSARGLAVGNIETNVQIIVRRCVGNGGGIGISVHNSSGVNAVNIYLEECTGVQNAYTQVEDRGAILCVDGRVMLKGCIGLAQSARGGFGLALDGTALPTVAPIIVGGYFVGGTAGLGLGSVSSIGIDLANTIIVAATFNGPTNAVVCKSTLGISGLRMQNCNLIGALGSGITLAAVTAVGENAVV